eukprot:3512359-Pyramimonas_sp.AAC.1
MSRFYGALQRVIRLGAHDGVVYKGRAVPESMQGFQRGAVQRFHHSAFKPERELVGCAPAPHTLASALLRSSMSKPAPQASMWHSHGPRGTSPLSSQNVLNFQVRAVSDTRWLSSSRQGTELPPLDGHPQATNLEEPSEPIGLHYTVYTPTNIDDDDAAQLPDIHIPIKMFYIGEHIDFQGMVQEYPYAAVPLSSRALNRDCLIVILSNMDPPPIIPNDPGRYIVVFKYGSVVCFNLSLQEIQDTLEIARRYTTTRFDNPQSDDYTVVIRPSLKEWSIFEGDCVVLRRLDVNNLRVISSVLGQTVALYHYELQVDKMLELFSELNSKTESTGTFSMSKRRLFQLVAALNKLMVDSITKLGLLKRSDTAWHFAQYGEVWEGIRKDFELDERFESLNYKLELIITQAKFYMEILQNRKSDTLEWTIIILIGAEIC